MKSYIFAFIALFLMCQCTSNKEKSIYKGQELNKSIFNPQFLEIVNNYVSSHKEFDTYMIISSSEVAKATSRRSDQKGTYYIMPATLRYRIDYSKDHNITYSCLSYDDDLALYICVCNKPVYIKSDIDKLSSRILPNDSIMPRTTSLNKEGNIWCFYKNNKNKFVVVSKNVERNGNWSGVLIEQVPNKLQFHR
jgi:uncharacterized protein YcfL